jgi:hypothetical protein
MMTESEITNALLAALAAELTPMISSDEVTSQMLAEKTGVSWSKAISILNGKVASGELMVRDVRLPNGHNARAFRMA